MDLESHPSYLLPNEEDFSLLANVGLDLEVESSPEFETAEPEKDDGASPEPLPWHRFAMDESKDLGHVVESDDEMSDKTLDSPTSSQVFKENEPTPSTSKRRGRPLGSVSQRKRSSKSKKSKTARPKKGKAPSESTQNRRLVSESIERMRQLLPGVSPKLDQASVLDATAKYISFVQENLSCHFTSTTSTSPQKQQTC